MAILTSGLIVPDAPPVRRVEITMRRGENPKVFDADTKKELTANVNQIRIAPHGAVTLVELTLFRRDAKGALVFSPAIDGPEVEYLNAELVYLRGDWEAGQ